mmetsp:Transcript_25958/g.59754  ORF Transcript_25958/g.59754 Transcript_25958/m.59754 type:complete len:228 (+) Transcript_25958:727-1410(+)
MGRPRPRRVPGLGHHGPPKRPLPLRRPAKVRGGPAHREPGGADARHPIEAAAEAVRRGAPVQHGEEAGGGVHQAALRPGLGVVLQPGQAGGGGGEAVLAVADVLGELVEENVEPAPVLFLQREGQVQGDEGDAGGGDRNAGGRDEGGGHGHRRGGTEEGGRGRGGGDGGDRGIGQAEGVAGQEGGRGEGNTRRGRRGTQKDRRQGLAGFGHDQRHCLHFLRREGVAD